MALFPLIRSLFPHLCSVFTAATIVIVPFTEHSPSHPWPYSLTSASLFPLSTTLFPSTESTLPHLRGPLGVSPVVVLVHPLVEPGDAVHRKVAKCKEGIVHQEARHHVSDKRAEGGGMGREGAAGKEEVEDLHADRCRDVI